ncbi:TIGR01841 family phasin [Achromobacter sp. GG226]|uniref:TIGR01841 family phasin n=1 Tax=Verticiella alkaliphila TaxID=2779529 RepID=UPI001C0C17AF|nr:TIGR01841 family phasin [Verticiella sp. GG226]MBU4610552.1 TIGR01841 family phasin [Verticiella sp. GG226]
MSTVPPQFFASQKATFDTFLALHNTAFAGFEKLVDLNLRVVKASFDESAQKAQEMMALEDPQQAVAYATALAQPSTEKMVAYSKHVYDIMSGVQSDVAKLTEAQIAESQKQFSEAVDQFSKMAPAGSESAVAFMKSSMATANSAYDSFSKAAKQAAEVTESNITAAANATFEAAEAAKPAASSRARRTAA